MTDVASQGTYNSLVYGFVEGMAYAPLIDLIFLDFMFTARGILQSEHAPGSAFLTISILIALVFVLDVAKNVIIGSGIFGLGFAVSNLIGSVVGVYLFYDVFAMIVPEAASDLVIFTSVLGGSVALSGILTLRSWRSRS